MLKRLLGGTGIEVSVLGLGTAQFGRAAGLKYRRRSVLPSDGRIADLLALAKRLGVNLLDTAPAYGSSEERLGEAIAGDRAHWVLCSKAGEEFDGARSRYDFSEAGMLASVAASLNRLRTDVIDILLLHSDGRDAARIEAIGGFRALRRLRREGMVRAVGFSGKDLADGMAALPHVDALMCTVNGQRRDELPLIAAASVAGVGVLVKKPLASGFAPDPRQLAATAALPGVTSVVVGTTNLAHLAANAAAVLSSTP